MKHRFLLPGSILSELAALIAGRSGLNTGREAFTGNLDERVLSDLGFVSLAATLAYALVEMPGRLFFNRVAGTPRPVAPVGVP